MPTTTTDSARLERSDPHCVHPTELPRLLGSAPWRRLLVLGDSIAAGDGDSVDGYDPRSWADRLAATLRAVDGATEYLNLGQRGLVAREVVDTQLAAGIAFAPDLAVVSAGANDMLRRSFDRGTVAPELDELVGRLADAGCLVVTFGLFDLSRTGFVPDALRGDLRRRLQDLNGLVREVTERHGGVHVDFFDHPALDDSLFSADMVHPNRRGHACIVASVVHALAGRARRQPSGPDGKPGEATGKALTGR